MGSINVEYNGKSIPIANVGIVSSKEKTILGNPERDLILQTLGSIQVQVGNKFYELPFSLNNGSSSALNIKSIESIDSLNIDGYPDGTFIYDQKSGALYLVYNRKLIIISGEDSDNDIFLSYINDQTLTGLQKNRLVLNAGQFLNSLQDVKRFNYEDVYDGMIIFANDEKTHYILMNSQHPNELSSWETFYIGSQGGVIKNGLVIKNQTRENLLFLNGINDFNPTVFNGLKIGSNDSWVKASVDVDNKTCINYNTKDFLIKNGLSPILHVSNKNIGIGGYASGSDSYNILLTGTVKLNDPLYTDKKIVSTDYTTTNITHWDGGKGFGLTHGSDNKWFFEVDDLLVRGSIVANKMILKELEVERAYATGGHMLVTDGAVVNSYSYRLPTAEEIQTANITYNGDYGTLDGASYYYFVTFKETTEKDDEDSYVSLPTDPAIGSSNADTNNIEKDTLDVDKNCPFIAGDVLLCQTASGLTAKKYYCLVSYSTNKYIAIKSNNFRNNAIYQRDTEGNPISIVKDFSIESNDALIRITNILVDNQSIYKYKERRRFIDIDGTRNQITMYDNLGNPNLFTEELNPNGFYDDINIITGIGSTGSLKLRMGELSDLGISGLTGYGLYADNVYLKGKLIVKNDDIETELGANRGLWVLNNTNTYYINDLISYNGSSYRCVVKHTNTAESNAIPGISSFWEIWIQKGNDGVAGTSFRYVDISGEQVFVYDQELDSFDKVNIPLSCTAFNIDYANLVNIKFDWSIGDTTIKSRTYLKAEVLSGTIIDSINIYPRGINETINWDNYWVENKSISVTCKVYTNDSLTYDSDVFSVYKIKNGEDSYSVLLSNEAMTVPCLPDGSFPSNIFDSPYKYQTQLQVYNGITKLIYGQDYSISFTNGLISLVNSSAIGQNHGLLSVSGFSTTDLTIDSGSIDITVNILRDSVIFLSFIKTISISKAKQGPLLDWIKEWDQNSTVVGADKIISPRIFTGTNDVNGITGVTLGRNAFGLTEVGVGGYYHSQSTFSLNTNGEIIIGAKNNSITYQATTYNAGTNYLSFSLANGLEISADVKFKDPNGSYTLQGYVANNTPTIYRNAYTTTINKSTFAPVGIKDKDLWYPMSYDSGSISYNGYFFIYDSAQTGDKWLTAGDNTITTINGGIITSGTIQLGASGTTNSGITGLTDVGDANPVRFWAGETFANRNIADFKVHENGLLEIGNTNPSYTLDGNGLLTTGTGLILYTDPTTHAGGLSTKKLGIKPDGSVYIDGSVLVSNIAGSSENIALSQLLSYFVLKTVEGVNFLSTTYPVVSEKEIVAYGSSILPGEGGGGSGLITSVLGSSGLGGSYLDSDLTDTFNAYTINSLHNRINSLEAGSALTFTTVGSGNAVTSVTKSATSVTVTKGLTFSVDGHTHSYLPLSGGQLTGQLGLLQGSSGGIIFPNDSFGGGGDSASIKLLNPAGGESTEMTFTMTNDADDIINFSVPSIDGVKINRYTVWHAGNDGAGSGLDADLLRGVAPSSLAVLSATKLANTRYLWGNAFTGEGDVTGIITFSNYGAHIVMPTGYIGCNIDDSYFWNASNHPIKFGTNDLERIRIAPTGNVLIGTSTDSGYKLDVNGTFRTTGAAYLNSTLKVTGASTLTGLLTANGGIGGTTGTFSSTVSASALSTTGYWNNALFVENLGDHIHHKFNGVHTVSFGGANEGYAHRNYYFRPAASSNGTTNAGLYIQTASASATPVYTSIHAFDNVGNATHVGYVTGLRFYAGYDANINNSISCSNWFRSNGSTGWYNDTYGAGILSDTANIVRTYNTNKFKVYNTEADSIYTLGGLKADGNSTLRGITLSNGTNTRNMTVGSNGGIQISGIIDSFTYSLPATIGWYRVAVAPVGIERPIGQFDISWTLSSYHGAVSLTAGMMYASSPFISQSAYTTFGTCITKSRIVYHTTFSGNYAYLEIYNETGKAVSLTVKGYNLYNWSLYSASTVGSIPSGYSNKEITHISGYMTSGNVAALGEITAYSASDRRLKENIRPLTNSLSIIELLNPVSYKWNSIAKELNPLKDNNTDYGLIAQELECVMPELVHTIYGGQYKSVDYVKIIPHLICAIKQLKIEVDHLKKTYY